MSNSKCEKCDQIKDDTQIREFKWHYRPKAKYNIPSSWRVLEVELCNQCYSGTKGCEYVVGRDWWDAVDNLFQSFNTLIRQENNGDIGTK